MFVRLVAAVALVMCGSAWAQTPPPDVAVHVYGRNADGALLLQIENIIKNDLRRTERFNIVEAPSDALESVSAPPNFGAAAGVEYGIVVDVASTRGGLLELQFRTWDLAGRAALSGFSLRSSPENVRRLAHRIADNFLLSSGGTAEFDSRFVGVSGEGANARVVIADADGANPFFLTAVGAVSQPAFTGRAQVAYVRGSDAGAQLEVLNLETNRRAPIGPTNVVADGGVSGERDSEVIAFVTDEAEPDIALYDLARASLTSLDLDGPQTEPTVLMGGAAVAFLSGPPDARSVVIASAGGTPVNVGEPGNYVHLAWSRDGRQFALVRQTAAGMELCVMPADASAPPRVVLSAPSLGRPSWSPNGAMVVVAIEGRLEIVDVVSLKRSPLALPFPAVSQPSWSGLLN